MQSRSRTSFRSGLAAPAFVTMTIWGANAVAAPRPFDLPSQDAPDAITEFARQAGIQILAPSEKIRGIRLPSLHGTYEIREALEILLAGTGLMIVSDDGKFITLREQPLPKPRKRDRTEAMRPTPRTQATFPPPPTPSIEEVIVTGSHIVREGYEAPTPLTVVGVEELQKSPDSNLLNIMNALPALIGSSTTSSTTAALSPASAGLQALNLRSLGASRVLVLLDGRRAVGSSISGLVDIASFPSQLISRVDIVTGGASAVYGSDAVAGVVNFILDKKFTGAKGELSGGVTNYGDGKNYKIELSAGFGFADDRGHVLISGKHEFNSGIEGDGGRVWNRRGILQMSNPAYTATNGQPQQLVEFNASTYTFALGGIITSGPLKGTVFGSGGMPFRYQDGVLYSNPYTVGGDWQLGDLRPFADLDPRQAYDGVFTRVGYDVTDDIDAFVQWGWNQTQLSDSIAPVWVLGGTANAPAIQVDNAYLPTSVRAAMVANNITSFQLGTSNGDMALLDAVSLRVTNRIDAGLEGSVMVFDRPWRWSITYGYGATKVGLHAPSAPLRARFLLATDAVVNPANGQIVCRSSLSDPTSRCRPWNVMGIGVNLGNQAAEDWINNDGQGGFQHALIEQKIYTASFTGEPFAVWAGPVSLAISFEHRNDVVNAPNDAFSAAGGHILGNIPALFGQQAVTEGAIETVLPLATAQSWAQSWDFTAAARFTGYELSGFAATYKIGTTYTPVDDIKLRITRSRDIRAPNLQELFAPVNIRSPSSQIIDRLLPGSPTYAFSTENVTGNSKLLPERADTTGVGIVLHPRFLSNFTISVDFWDVDVRDAITPLSPQQVIDTCSTGRFTSVCPNIVRSPVTGLITQVQTYSINLATQDVRGLDLETSYRMQAADIISDWRGTLSLHGLATFYLRNYQDNTFQAPTDRVGENAATNPPHWKLTATAGYALDPVTVSLTARAISAGAINTTYIECTSGCPAATIDHLTINNNHIAGRAYVDANVSYKVSVADASFGEVFFSAKNLLNNDPPAIPTSFLSNLAGPAVLYDAFGVVFRAGVRFRM